MTNKQAIEKLNDIRCHVKETSIEEQALVMAIEALKKAGIYGDIIYREDALMCLTGEYPADFKHDELIAKFIRRIRKLPSAQPEQRWIPCSERLPDDLAEVNVTWVNHDPEPYYGFAKNKPFTASAVYYEGKWYWYSSVCADVLGEYGRNDVDAVDDTIEITAWQPLPEPYKGEQHERSDQ